jgi:5-methylcytosine-specific restriction endonuclease McrA
MSHRVLLLNSWYLPHAIIPWHAAIKLVYEKTVDVVAEYSETISSPSVTWQMPAVVRLRKPHRARRAGVKFSRMNVYLRDRFTCQYCGQRFEWEELSYDHVVPRTHGGRTNFQNITTACKPCNTRKADRSCDEAGMFPRTLPIKPDSLPHYRPLIELERAPVEWHPFLKPVG